MGGGEVGRGAERVLGRGVEGLEGVGEGSLEGRPHPSSAASL